MSITDWLEWLAQKRELILTLGFFAGFFGAALAETLHPYRRTGQEFGARWGVNVTLVLGNWMAVAWLVPEPGSLAAQFDLPALQAISAWLSSHPVLGTLTSILIIDMARYWVHRLSHRVHWLWRLHAIHHSDTDLDATTGFRHHPLEYVAVSAIMTGLYVLLGVPVAALVIYGVLAASIAPFTHANTILPTWLERALNKIFITNQFHALHHSVDMREGNSNFGIVFSIWDRMFKTCIEPSAERYASIRFGVEGVSAEAAASLREVLLQPFRRDFPGTQDFSGTRAIAAQRGGRHQGSE